MKLQPKQAARVLFGYNAIEDKDRRQAPSRRIKSEDDVLTSRKRSRLQSTALEQTRNHSLIQWAVNRHVAYVADFRTSIRTGKEDVDTLLKRIMQWHGAPRNFDISGRLGRTEFFGLMERSKIVMGDSAAITLDNLKMQAIESDLIRKAGDYKGEAEVNDSGLVVGDYGETIAYSICNRGANGYEYTFDHLEPASNVFFAANWTRFGSQFRGVSPLSTALNTVQDLMEATEYNLLKAKLAALFGIAFTRSATADGSFGGAGGATAETADAATTASGTSQDLNPRGINIIDLNPGEDVKSIESQTPSTEFVEGCYLYIQLALLALNIPITAFDSRRSSFSARIADLNEYEVAARNTRRQNLYLRQDYSNWLLREIWMDTESPWPLRQVAERNGMNLRDVQEAVEWVAAGYPWLDKLRQITGDEKAIELRVDNAEDAARRRGSDVYRNIDKQLEIEQYEMNQRAERGLPERVSGDPKKYDVDPYGTDAE